MKQNLNIMFSGCLVLVLIAVLFLPLAVVGQATRSGTGGSTGSGTSRCPPPTIDNPAEGKLLGISCFEDLVVRIIQILLAVAGAVAVVFLMVGGFQYVTARGNEEATEKAKKTITGAIIGIVTIVLAYAIVAIVNTLLVSPPT